MEQGTSRVGRPPSEIKNEKFPFRMPPSSYPLAEAQATATKRAFGNKFSEAIMTAMGQLLAAFRLLREDSLTKSERGMIEERAMALKSDLECLLKDDRNPERERDNLTTLRRMLEQEM